jgi:hypothetical protein
MINGVIASGSIYATSWVHFKNQRKYKIESGSFWNGYIDVGSADVESGRMTLSSISLQSTRTFQSGAITVSDLLTLQGSPSGSRMKIPYALSLSDGCRIQLNDTTLVSSSWFRSGARYFINRLL